jgi:GAF domain-containing protein
MFTLVIENFVACSFLLSLWGVGPNVYLTELLLRLTQATYGFSILMAVSLILHLAGKMKDFWVVAARAGFMALLLLQSAIWRETLLLPALDAPNRVLTPAGFMALAMSVIVPVIGIGCGIVYRRHIQPPSLLISLCVLLISQAFAALLTPLRELQITSLVSALVGTVVGVELVRLQVEGPLQVRDAQLKAIHTLSTQLANHHSLSDVLKSVSEQAMAILDTDLVVIYLADQPGELDEKLIVVAQTGGEKPEVNLRHRVLYPGEGLAGRVYQLQESIQIANYQQWEGIAPAYKELPLFASMSIPLLDGNDVLGVLNLHETKNGRVFGMEDQRIAQLLAAQAAIAVSRERMRYALDYWQRHAHGQTKRITNSIHFDQHGKLVLGGDVSPLLD